MVDLLEPFLQGLDLVVKRLVIFPLLLHVVSETLIEFVCHLAFVEFVFEVLFRVS